MKRCLAYIKSAAAPASNLADTLLNSKAALGD